MSSLILDSLEIRGFRCFRHLQIERLGRVNLIVGKNNVGKTSLLEALWLFAQRNPSFIWELLEDRNESERAVVDAEGLDPTQDRLTAVSQLFFGRNHATDDQETIEIGAVGQNGNRLKLKTTWANNGRLVSETPSHNPAVVRESPMPDSGAVPLLIIDTAAGQSHYRLDRGFQYVRAAQPIPHIFLPADGLTPRDIETLWDRVALTNLEDQVLKAIQLIAPENERIGLGTIHRLGQKRIPIVKVKGLEHPIPLRALGEGLNRLFGIALALVSAKNGLLLIDEIESGLHYSVFPKLWQFVLDVANQLDIQVFATTHSWDCIVGFQYAAQKNEDVDGMLIRLENRKGEIVPILFDEERLAIATREDLEVR
jgi:hypothetical protein